MQQLSTVCVCTASEKTNLALLDSVKNRTPCTEFLFFFFQAKQSETDSENTVITDDEESVANTPQDEKYNKV